MKKVYTIGRDPQSDIVISDPSDYVSRLHATIRIDGGKMYIIDQSQNGTYVNGMRMSSNEEIPVSRKDTVSFANVAELDWTLLPDPAKERLKIVSLSAMAVVLAACIFGGVSYLNSSKTVKEDSVPAISSGDDSVVGEKVTGDENVRDTVALQPAETDKSAVKKGDAKSGRDRSQEQKPETEQEDNAEKTETTQTEPETIIPLY